MSSYDHSLNSDGEPNTVELFSQVLLIEDDQGHAAVIRRALASSVGDIRLVHTGGEALESLENNFTELVLCDLHLPDMSGMSVIRGIREARPTLPIIVITSSSDLNDAVQAMREGAWDYMVKQFTGDLKNQIALTLRRTAERKLQQLREIEVRRERDAFWVAAFAAQDGLALLGDKGSVVFANAAFRNVSRMLGGDGDLSNLVDLIAGQDYEVAHALHNELENPTADSLWKSELRIEGDSSQSARYFELQLSSISPSRIEDFGTLGSIVPQFRYHVLWLRDITWRKEQERIQRDLLATTTHDLKGPLGAILTSSELLGEEQFEVKGRGLELLTRISSCARNSLSIIDELLSARRIQDGLLVLRPRWHRMFDFVEDVVLDYQPIAKAKSIEFIACHVDKAARVYADKIGLERVLGNLVNNALKFTRSGGKVEVSAERVGNRVRFTISDTGPGIESNARHELFERFTRLEKHGEVEGTGLGLFVTKKIIDAHNGQVEVKSTVGVGTMFVVTLPDGPDEE